MEVNEEEKPKRQNANETKAQLWLHFTLRIAALGMDAFKRGPPMIIKIHAYLDRELNLAESEGEKSAGSRQDAPDNTRGIRDRERARRRKF